MDTAATPQSFEQRFDADGLDLVSSVDAGRPPRYPTLVNVRQIRRGEFRTRPALNSLSVAPAAKTPWHSVRRLNDKVSGNYTLASGIGTELFSTPSAAAAAAPGNPAARDTGYSGNPLSLLPFRPENDVATWMAVGDASKLRKLRLDGTVHRLGLPQPTRPPDVGLDWVWGLQRVDIIDAAAAVGAWSVSVPGAIAPNNLQRANAQCVVQRSLWADGFDPTAGLVSGWRSIEVLAAPSPNGLANIGPGTVLRDALGHDLVAEEIHPPTPAATTIASILFDDGGTGAGIGWCTIVPVAAYREFQQHAIIKTVGAGTTYGVITSVIHGPDNTLALRCYLQGGPIVAGDTLEVRPTIFAWCGTFFPNGALSSQSVRYQNLATASTNYTLVKGGLALNLSSYPTSNKQIDFDNDEMHVSLFASDWSLVDSIKVQLDLDDGTFTKNYVSWTIRQADLLAFQTNNLSAIDVRDIQVRNRQLNQSLAAERRAERLAERGGLGGRSRDDNGPTYDVPSPQTGGPTTDDPGGSSSQGTTGTSQWAEIRFKLSDLISGRFGADISKGFQNVTAIQLVVARNAAVGGPDVAVGSWWIGGGSPPDVGKNAPYEYRYRYRCSSTGTRSNWSPPGRTLAWPHRYSVYVQTYNTNSLGNPVAPAEVDKIDIQRRGGSVNTWVTVGTVDSAGANPYWTDVYDDVYALGASEDPLALESNVNDQPFTIQQSAFIDTATTVSGTLIRHVGAFAAYLSGGNTSILEQGTGLIVGGTATSLYRVLSADLIEVFDNIGSGANVKLEMPSPHLVGQPLPIFFGDVDGWYFACGDSKNPGRLYVFNQNTLDSAPGNYIVDITDPSDPLQNGCSFMGRGYVWSGNAMYVLSIDVSLPDAPVRFERLMSSVGMYSRYALAVGDAMYWLGKDGIYASDGGASHNITSGVLAPLFPTKQSDGADTNGIPAPAMTYANATADGAALHQFRLSYTYDKTLWFDYIDGTSTRRTLGLMRAAGTGIMVSTGTQEQWGWWYDTYANGALFHYSAEGENVRQILCGGTSATAKLYSMGASVNGDDGTPIACQVRSFAYDADSPRPKKLFNDAFLDADPGGASLAVKLYFDNFATSFTPTASPLIGSGRPNLPVPLDINSGRGEYTRNCAIDVSWTVTAAQSPVLYRWGGSVYQRPDETIQRSTDFTDCGFWGPKEFRGADVECSSANYDVNGVATPTAKTLVFEYTKDDGTVGTVAVNVTVGEKSIVPVAFTTPVIGYEIRIRPSDSNTWKQYDVKQWHFDALADLTALITPWDNLDVQSYVQGVELFADSNGVNVSLSIQRDFGAVAATIPIANHPGRGWKSYSFAAPFLAYLLRIVPSGPIRLMKWRWLRKPEAPLGDVWEAQEVEMGDPFGFAQYAEIEYASTTTVTLRYTLDGTLVLADSATLTATGGIDPGTFRKVRVVFPAAKGRLCKIRLESSAQFRIREGGTGVYRKSFGANEGFRFAPLIGASHGHGADA